LAEPRAKARKNLFIIIIYWHLQCSCVEHYPAQMILVATSCNLRCHNCNHCFSNHHMVTRRWGLVYTDFYWRWVLYDLQDPIHYRQHRTCPVWTWKSRSLLLRRNTTRNLDIILRRLWTYPFPYACSYRHYPTD
jgi:hypothetical protein